MLFFWTFYSSKNPENKHQVYNVDKKCLSCKSAYYSRMISEGSFATEDWSNVADNSALITEIYYILGYIQIQNSYFKLY